MSALPETDDYRALFLTPTPMIDLRAPLEFARGAFPCALNLPLMTDEERAKVGTLYKREGQQAAIALGHQLVSGAVKEQRIATWCDFARAHPQGYLYCWRGGLRSQTVQQWLADAGVRYPRVAGGYKAMRRFLLDELDRCVDRARFILISGKTGTGKTRVIERLARCIDLEGLANHRGSSFGQMPNGQPSQIDFENAVSIALLRLLQVSQNPVMLEDEGRLIGRVALPENLRLKMKGAPMLVVEAPLEARVTIVMEDYIVDLGKRYALLYGEDGAGAHREKMLSDLARIRKRLGGERYQSVSTMMNDAFFEQWRTGDAAAHRPWIACLLEQYYDPMYQYQLEQREGEVLFCGPREQVLERATGYAQPA